MTAPPTFPPRVWAFHYDVQMEDEFKVSTYNWAPESSESIIVFISKEEHTFLLAKAVREARAETWLDMSEALEPHRGL